MPNINHQPFIIAMGASAGGLEPISAFFDYTPLDAVSYIVIQHFSADYKSLMAELLGRHSKLEVIEAKDNMKVESNKVYLIPSDSFMIIREGRLQLSEKKDQPRPHMTIDCFFTSLAEALGKKAIGIVLSGTGHDGSSGIEAIKKAGGIVFVQDPETASFRDMPLSAIATGYADIILSPQAMPQVIEEYVKSGVLESLAGSPENDIGEQELSGVIDLIKGNLPLDFTDYKRPTILRRIKRRMVQNDITEVHRYVELLNNDSKELEILANDFLIGVTSFFRDPEAFTIIEKKVIPDLLDRKDPGDTLKIWVAGCASGEEAYSMAILAKECMEASSKDLEVKIFATDINRAALDTASKGIYTDKIEKTVSPHRLERFFTKVDGGYKINYEIRKMLIFAQHNLASNPPYCNIDLISCRNLLIYLNAVLQKKVFSMMHFGLKKGGYLFLGPSENADVLKDDFTEISAKWNISKSHKSGSSMRFDSFMAPVMDGLKTTQLEISPKGMYEERILPDELNIVMWEESGYTAICTDAQLRVIQTFGNPSAYLKSQILQFNLNELLPDHLVLLVKAAAHDALTGQKKVTLDGLNFGRQAMAEQHLVNLVFRPYRKANATEDNLLIIFIENSNQAKAGAIMGQTEIERLTQLHVTGLEKALAEAEHQLKVAHERILASNENMQSFNEELLSANEEMQSANEELQSVNEELQTINKEHQLTNAALTESNDDLNNYFRSNPNAQLFVDRDLLLKKYSPGSIKHINIRETDIGRPLSNITTNIALPTLIEDIQQVMDVDQVIIREAMSVDGRIYQVTTMPYLKKDSRRPDGAIISFYDITELKQLLKTLDTSNKGLLRINADLNTFVYSASHDLNAPIFNIEMLLMILNKKIDLRDPQVLEISEMIGRAINSFKAVTEDLVKVGHIEASMLEESALENIEELFNEIKVIISERIKAAGATFQTDFREKIIRFPRKNLRSILLNLSTNAIKFSHADRDAEIILATEKVEGYILLTVTDNGVGISRDKSAAIFNIYKRLNPDVEGQGVGLYLIKKMIDASGGKIEVESEIGKGSSFRVYFKQDEPVLV